MARKATTTLKSEVGESRKSQIASLFANGLTNFAVTKAMEAAYPETVEDDKIRAEYCEELGIEVVPFNKDERDKLGRAIRQVKGLMLKEDEELNAIMEGVGQAEAEDADDVEFRNRRRFSTGWPVWDWLFGTTYFKWEVDAPNSKYEKRKFLRRDSILDEATGKYIDVKIEEERDVWVSGDYKAGDLMPVDPKPGNWIVPPWTPADGKVEDYLKQVRQETGLPEAFLTLLAGAKGIGKSTTMVELVKSVNSEGYRALYMQGEEDSTDFRMKIGANVDGKLFKVISGEMMPLNRVIAEVYKYRPKLVIIDSAQMLAEWNKGIRGQSTVLSQLKMLKSDPDAGRPHFIIISQMTKKGDAAGPQKIQHMVDAVALGRKKEGQKDTFSIGLPEKNRGGETGRWSDFQHQPTGGIKTLKAGFGDPIYKLLQATSNPVIVEGVQPPKKSGPITPIIAAEPAVVYKELSVDPEAVTEQPKPQVAEKPAKVVNQVQEPGVYVMKL